MKNVLRVSFFFSLSLLWLLVSGISPAYADDPTATPTPTATWESLIKTPTPAPTQSNACPNGLPQGWLTVTPGLMWNAECANCLLTLTVYPTNTPVPQATWSGTGTPEATWTPVPSATATAGAATATPEATATPALWLGEPNDVYVAVNAGTQRGYSSYYPVDQPGGNVIRGFCIETLSTTGGGKPAFNQPASSPLNGNTSNWTTGNGWKHYVNRSGNNVSSVCQAMGGSWTALPVGVPTFYDGATRNLQMSIENTPCCNWPNPNNLTIRVWPVWYGSKPSYTPTPGAATATPTATQDARCNAVTGYGGSDGFGESLPLILLGPAQCYGVTEIEIPMSAFNLLTGWELEDASLPWLSICFRALRFGSFNLFGVSIDLDWIAFIMAGVAIVRWLLRS